MPSLNRRLWPIIAKNYHLSLDLNTEYNLDNRLGKGGCFNFDCLLTHLLLNISGNFLIRDFY